MLHNAIINSQDCFAAFLLNCAQMAYTGPDQDVEAQLRNTYHWNTPPQRSEFNILEDTHFRLVQGRLPLHDMSGLKDAPKPSTWARPVRSRSTLDESQQASRKTKAPRRTWSLLRKQPASFAISLLFLGTACAIGHHIFYEMLDSQEASAQWQQWNIRIGTALAFTITISLRGAAVFGYDQYMWNLMRRKAVTIAGLDNLFSLTSNVFALFSTELLRRAPMAVLIALLTW